MKSTKTSLKIDTMKIGIVALLALNVLLGVYIAFIKPGAYSLEAMKAWGRENMKMAQQLYQSDVYIQQQKMTLEQILGSINQMWNSFDDTPQLFMENESDLEFDFVETE